MYTYVRSFGKLDLPTPTSCAAVSISIVTITRLVPIMLLKLLILALEQCSRIFPYYAQMMLHYALLIQSFLSLNYIIMSINSISSSSIVLTIYLHTRINTLNSFLLHFATLVNTYYHILTQISQFWAKHVFYIIFSIMLAIFAYSIMLALCLMLLPPYYAQIMLA